MKKIEYNWDNLINQKRFSLYFKKFDDYNNFVKRQFISASDYLDAPKDESGSRGSLSEEKAVEIVSGMMRAIKNRAVLLST